jgi:shikimate kinase / 3-dehydroquinate synthase
MGAGKSTIGARIARSRGVAFVDLDEELEAAFAVPISAVFERWGEPAFRAMEERLLKQAITLPNRVVALGGGAVSSASSRSLLRDRATWVHLDVTFAELERRVLASGGSPARPLWADASAVHELFEARRADYAEAPMTVDADGPPDQVAQTIDALLERLPAEPPRPTPTVVSHRLQVRVPGADYPVVVGRDMAGVGAAIAGVGVGPVAVLTDWNVGPLHLDRLRSELRGTGRDVLPVTLPAGEDRKETRPVLDAVDRLLDHGWQRSAPVVALGGGVLGDMSGLVASLVLRGVPFVQVPTTLLAMVDSSVGGKVGVNHRQGKNLIGHFHQPSLVWTDLAYLDTLPDRELRAGLGEVVKTALIGDRELFEQLEATPEAYLARDPAVVSDAVLRCCRVKAGIVSADALERGQRAVLNLGHTIGHGLEAVCGYGRLRHGEAVSIGLVAAAEIGAEEGLGPADLPARLRGLLQRLGLPTVAPALPIPALRDALMRDKKLKGDALTWILVSEIGDVLVRPSPITTLQERLDLLIERQVLTHSGG